MRKIYAVCLVTVLVSCGDAPRAGEDGGGRTIIEQHDAAVSIVASCLTLTSAGLDASGWFGSGVLIGKDRVLTASHVVECSGRLSLTVRHRGAEYHGETVVMMPQNDVALVRLIDANIPEIRPPVLAPLNTGSTVCPANAMPKERRACGVVTQHNEPWTFFEMQTPADDVVPGNSGSGVYDEHGRLVGIVVAIRRDNRQGVLSVLAPVDFLLRVE